MAQENSYEVLKHQLFTIQVVIFVWIQDKDNHSYKTCKAIRCDWVKNGIKQSRSYICRAKLSNQGMFQIANQAV